MKLKIKFKIKSKEVRISEDDTIRCSQMLKAITEKKVWEGLETKPQTIIPESKDQDFLV